MTLALGTGEVTMIDLANAYTTFHSAGQYADPMLIAQVRDGRGTVLEENSATFSQNVSATTAFLATSLMRSVVEEGTAMAVLELNRPAAGKTGTAQEYRDAWFTGYTADYVASAWVGFDNHDPIGPNETGGKAALPIWLRFMKGAHVDLPVRDFEVPAGIVAVKIDPQTGLLAGNKVPGRTEWFLEGTEPTQETHGPGGVDPHDFLLHDQRGGL